MSNKRRKNFDEPLQSNQNSYAFLDKENIVSFKRKSIPKKKNDGRTNCKSSRKLGKQTYFNQKK